MKTDIISVQEFAKKYAGHEVKWVGGRNYGLGDHSIGTIAGYEGSVVLLFYTDKAYAVWGATATHHPTYTIGNDIIDKFKGCGMHGFYPYQLEVIKKWPKVKPYPNICKRCKAPSRNTKYMTFCSNIKCKANNTMKHIASLNNNKENIIDGLDAFQYIVCRTCMERCVNAYGTDTTHATNVWKIHCKNNEHNFERHCNNGDKLNTHHINGTGDVMYAYGGWSAIRGE
jgi:hypothetical protein